MILLFPGILPPPVTMDSAVSGPRVAYVLNENNVATEVSDQPAG